MIEDLGNPENRKMKTIFFFHFRDIFRRKAKITNILQYQMVVLVVLIRLPVTRLPPKIMSKKTLKGPPGPTEISPTVANDMRNFEEF